MLELKGFHRVKNSLKPGHLIAMSLAKPWIIQSIVLIIQTLKIIANGRDVDCRRRRNGSSPRGAKRVANSPGAAINPIVRERVTIETAIALLGGAKA